MSGKLLLTIEDYGNICREVYPREMFDAAFGTYGAPDFESNTNNIDGFRRLRLRPGVLAQVAERRLSTQVLGEPIDFPVMVAPIGGLQRAHVDGELAVARAAGRAGTVMAVSTRSNYTIEEVAHAASGPLWFQLYFFKDRELNRMLLERATAAGYKAIVVTVDNAVAQFWNDREYRGIPAARGYPSDRRPDINFAGMDRPNLPTVDNFVDALECNLAWSDLDWLRANTALPIIVKGIQTAEDAALCVEHGVDGLVVSNHGGHTMNRLKGTIETLPEVVDAVDGRLEIYLDGGIRTGIDVLIALALGARAVLIGRAVMWGLNLGGEEGVYAVLGILRNELMLATGLCGVKDVNGIDSRLVRIG